MVDLLRLDIKVNDTDVGKADRSLGRLEGAARRTETATARMGRAFSSAMKFAVGFGVAIGAVAGIRAFADQIGAAVKRLEEMDRLSAQLDRALGNSGNTAHTSAAEIGKWADQLEMRTGRAAEEVMAVSTNLATFGFGRQQFFRALELANDMSASWGGDLRQNLEGLSRALADPEKGLAMLTKRGITFEPVQQRMIANFLRQNDLAGAQGVIFGTLEGQVKGIAERGYGGLTRAWHTFQKTWEDGFESLVNGEGKTYDLRHSLEDLLATISSPDFVNSVMQFGTLLLNMMNNLARAANWAMQQFQSFKNYLASQSSVADPSHTSNSDISARLGGIERQRQELAAQKADLENRLANPSIVDRIPGNSTTQASLLADIPGKVAALDAESRRLMREADQRSMASVPATAPSTGVLGFGDDNPYSDYRYSGGHAATKVSAMVKDATKFASDALDDLASKANELGDTVKSAFSGIGSGLLDAIRNRGNVVGSILDMLTDKAWNLASTVLDNSFNSIIGNLVGGLTGGGGAGLGSLSSSVGKAAISGLPHFANGGAGFVSGVGGVDSKLFMAKVTPGEPYAFGNAALRGMGQPANGNAAFSLTIINQSGEPVRAENVQQKRNASGGLDITATIVGAMKTAVADGSMDGVMNQVYGVQRRSR